MKQIVAIALLCILGAGVRAQDKDVASLSIRVEQPEREYLSASSCRILQTKMTQILTRNGIAKDLPSNRFVMTAKANVLGKDIIAGSPSRVSEQIELTFIIGDVLDNIKYGTYVVNLVGVGINEEQALVQAVKNVRTNDKGMDAFIETAKTRIVKYYRDNEDKILQEANVLVAGSQFDQAIYLLSMVPDACGECYDHCQAKILEINKLKIDTEGESLFSQAKAKWAKSPNAEGAEEVYPLVAAISPSASCYPKVRPFLNQIQSKLVADEKRAWEFKMKQYDDQVAKEKREFEARVEQDKREAEIRKQNIEAARQVAVEYARNQPKEVYYYNTILLW